MTKEFSVHIFDDEIIISSSFFLERGHSDLNDLACDSFKTVIKGYDEDAEYNPRQVSLNPSVDIEDLKAKLIKYGFCIKQKKGTFVEKVEESNQDTSPKEELKFNETLQVKDILKYIEAGREFTQLVRIGTNLTLAQIIDRAFKNYPFQDKDYYFIPINEFIEQVEVSNKFLLRLAPKFKGKDSLSTLLEWRKGDFGEFYKQMYKKFPADTLKAGQILDGYEVIEGFRIYQYFYKFGSKNVKQYGTYKDWIFLRPFRWDYILFAKRSFLTQNNSATILRLTQPSVLP